MRLLLSAFVLLVLALPAWAHPMPQSVVLLDVEETGVRAEVHLPLSELEIGFGQTLVPEAVRTSAALRAEIGRYLAAHLSGSSPDGTPWATAVRSVVYHTEPSADGLGTIDEAVAEVWLAAPGGASTRAFTFHYDAVVHELLSHNALVSVRSDWRTGLTGAEPEFVGRVDWNTHELAIDRTGVSAWAGFAAAFALGAHHIAEGTDHLLFLLVLLLPAVLVVAPGGRRWGGAAEARPAARRLLWIVTAFTVGHSLTLALGALGGVRLPSGPVEVVIALSILVSAVHAVRPLFPHREALVAGAFGLVHGLAFADVIAGMALGPWQSALTLVGFNLGIEAVQLVVVAVAAPLLFTLARTPAYTPVRLVGAMLAGVAASAWAAERALGWENPLTPWVEGAARDAVWLVVGLAAVALAAAAWERVQARRTTAPAG